MKAISAILFSIFFLLTTMQQTTLLLLYKFNEKSITEKYCVNKDVVGSCCKGKCHLNKTIAKSENENTKNPFSSSCNKLKEVEIFFLQINKVQEFSSSPFAFSIQYSTNYLAALLKGVEFTPIKPPTV